MLVDVCLIFNRLGSKRNHFHFVLQDSCIRRALAEGADVLLCSRSAVMASKAVWISRNCMPFGDTKPGYVGDNRVLLDRDLQLVSLYVHRHRSVKISALSPHE